MFKVIKMNREIVNIYNSQVIREFTNYMDNIVETMSEKEIMKLFTRKYYVWNYIRHKDFYKLMSSWVGFVPNDCFTSKHFLVIKMVLDTANNDITRTSFMNAINKKRPVLTVDTIKYSDVSKVLDSELDNVVTDQYTEPFLHKIGSLEEMVDAVSYSM